MFPSRPTPSPLDADVTMRMAHLDEIPLGDPEDPILWRAVRHHFGVRAFGVNAFVARGEGQPVIEDHVETGDSTGAHEELYVVLRGRAAFTVGDERLEAGAGTFLHLPDPATRRGAVALEPDTAVLAIGAPPGAPFRVTPWERRYFPDD